MRLEWGRFLANHSGGRCSLVFDWEMLYPTNKVVILLVIMLCSRNRLSTESYDRGHVEGSDVGAMQIVSTGPNSIMKNTHTSQ
jgi:hypothetical protein